MQEGKFITFEGGEGCGKSTQVQRLKAELERRGLPVLLTREPGGTRLAELIRGLLKDEREDPPVDKAELLLFLAARAQLVEHVILPALKHGTWVISDRFSDSTMAYQGYGRGMDLESIRLMNSFACGGLRPDLTLLLDVPLEVAHARMRSREAATATAADRIELAGDIFHQRLRDGFLAMQAAEPERIRLINADQPIDIVWQEIWKQISPIV